MKYKLKPVNIDAEKDGLEFPDIRERIIEKRGHVVEFSLKELEEAGEAMRKQRKEQEAMLTHRNAVIENIEHHHPFVKDFSEEELLTLWMYKDALGNRDMFKSNIEKLDKQLKEDEEEIKEILKQIPDLAKVKSAEVKDGELKMEGDK